MVVRYSSSEMSGSLIRVGESARPITKQMAKAPDAADADGTLEHITVAHRRKAARGAARKGSLAASRVQFSDRATHRCGGVIRLA